MSDYCCISFKKLEGNDVYNFLRKVKTTCLERMEDIAKDEKLYLPYVRKDLFFDIPEKLSDIPKEALTEAKEWACYTVFNFRFFYDEKTSLLGMFGVPSKITDIFDASVVFQTCTDHDYERKEWEGVELFTDIFDKWWNKPDEEIENLLRNDGYAEDEIDIEYGKRSKAYEEIWDKFSKYFYDDGEIFLTILKPWQLDTLKFVALCHNEAYKYQEEEKKLFGG